MMSIYLNWYDENERELHIQFDGMWTLDDFQDMIFNVDAMIGSKPHVVHVIADFTNSAPPSTAILPGIAIAVRHMNMNFGVAVILSQNELVNQLVQTATSMHPVLRQRVYVVNSLDVAGRIMSHYEKQRRVSV